MMAGVTMTHRLLLVCVPFALLVAACGDDAVCTTDVDGDGFGLGCETDCDDNDPLHHADCFTCSDPDGDGYGAGCDLGSDCAPIDGQHWADCGLCTGDNDGDGAGGDTCDILDCDDADPTVWTSCETCADADGDGAFVGCDDYPATGGPDCDDANALEFEHCGGCVDDDGDGHFAGCDLYDAGSPGPDCDDGDARAWDSCSTCDDNDVDGYYDGCDDYLGATEDCDPGSPLHWSDCGSCTDTDLDGAGPGCDRGADCNAADRDVWVSCATCLDNDGDLRFDGCDAYFTREGPDCNDSSDNEWSTCTCEDADGDTYFAGCDSYVGILGPDCNDGNPATFNTCGTCRDFDGDGHWAGCNSYTTFPGPDCNDSNVNNWTSCATCLDSDFDGFYAGCDAYTTIPLDCAPADGNHWSDCSNPCVDTDNDDRGPGCDLGADCDTTDGNHWSDCGLCNDNDDDGFGSGTCDLGTNDCDDANGNRYPGNTDSTIDGTDQNCDQFDTASIFLDPVADTAFSPYWTTTYYTTTTSDMFITSSYFASSSYSMNLGGSGTIIETATIDTSSCDSVLWRYAVKRGPTAPQAADQLNLQYWNGGAWFPLDSYVGNSFTDTGFLVRYGSISAADARFTGLRLRLMTVNGTAFSDDFYIDDFAAGCAPDLDGDGRWNTVDCAPADADHWNDCGGTCVDTDGDDFGPGCNLGPDTCGAGDPAINPRAADTTAGDGDQNCDGHDGPLTTQTYTATPALAITDSGSSAGTCGAVNSVNSQIVVPGTDTGTLFDVDVSINIAHGRASDLDVWLQYFDGTNTVCVQLTSDLPSITPPSPDTIANYTNTVFDDEAAFGIDNLNTVLVVAPPFTATFRPRTGTALSQVDGLSNVTTWTLYVNDDFVGTAGTLSSWSVTTRRY